MEKGKKLSRPREKTTTDAAVVFSFGILITNMKRLLVVCVVGVLLWPQAAVFGETDAERRARLEKELQVVEKQIIQQQSLLEGKQVERQSLERDLNILDTQINKAALGIEARELAIEQLTDQIGEKEEVIDILTERLQKQRQSIAELVRKTQVVDDYSLVELMLSNQNLSEFFVDFENYRVIND